MAESAINVTPGTGAAIDGFTLTSPANVRQSVVIGDPSVNAAAVSVQQFHNADNQNPGNTAYGLLTGGVAQLLNPSGNIDRQRETGFDSIPATGIATGSQQFAVPVNTTISAVAGAGTVTVTPVSMNGIYVGSVVKIDTGANVETVVVSTVSATTFTAIFTRAHGAATPILTFYYNQARDGSVGDNVVAAGLSASATYLYNAVSGLYEIDRSASGELDGASGRGTAVAAEYEFNGGGPMTNTGAISGLAFDRARSLQGKGLGVTSLNGATVAGATSIVVTSAIGLTAGEQIRLDRNTGTDESAYVSTTYVSGNLTVGLQNATAFAHNTAIAVEWDLFASGGPGLNGFNAVGIGIEEEALYNPVDGKFYIERSATQDNMPPQNIVAESGVEWNGTSFDRMRTPGRFVDIPTVAITAGTPVAVWTPAAGKKFRVMGFSLTLSVAGSIILKDAGNVIFRTPALVAATPKDSPPNMDNGFLSATINNVLNFDVTATGTVSGFVFGTEE